MTHHHLRNNCMIIIHSKTDEKISQYVYTCTCNYRTGNIKLYIYTDMILTDTCILHMHVVYYTYQHVIDRTREVLSAVTSNMAPFDSAPLGAVFVRIALLGEPNSEDAHVKMRGAVFGYMQLFYE